MTNLRVKKFGIDDPLLKTFLKLPWKIYKGYLNWVPPLIFQQKEILSRKNPFFNHAEVALFLATRGSDPVGRIAAIYDEKFVSYSGERAGFVGFFESFEDEDVSRALFDRAFSWLGERGLCKVVGPINLSMNYEVGLLVDGFEYPPCFLMPYNPPYYVDLFEGYGFKKAKDLLAFFVSLNPGSSLPEVWKRALRNRKVSVRSVDFDNLENEAKLILDIYSDAWGGNWGFVPPDEEEFRFISSSLKDIADKDLTLIMEVDGEPSGFICFIPDMNLVIKKMDGRLFPFGIFRWFLGKRKVKFYRAIALGVVKRYQRMGLEYFMFSETLKRALRKGITRWEVSWVLEDNFPVVNTILRRLGGKVYKRYRVFEKTI